MESGAQQIRQMIRRARRALTQEQQDAAALVLTEQVITHPKIIQAQRIACFLSFDGEINTHPLIVKLWQSGKQVYLPVIHPFHAGHLLFLRYAQDTSLVKNRYNIDEPQLDVRYVMPFAGLDVILTPMVAFDRCGNRMGMGGGYYDRLLQSWQQVQTYPLGIAHDCQYVEKLTTAQWDIPLPEIITPSKHWTWC